MERCEQCEEPTLEPISIYEGYMGSYCPQCAITLLFGVTYELTQSIKALQQARVDDYQRGLEAIFFHSLRSIETLRASREELDRGNKELERMLKR